MQGKAWAMAGASSLVLPQQACKDGSGYDVLTVYLSESFQSSFLTQEANNCTLMANSTDVELVISAQDAAQPYTFVPGVYTVDHRSVMALRATIYGNCSTLPSGKAAGTITITAIDSTHVAGSVDLTYTDSAGGSIRGTFDAPRGVANFGACEAIGLAGYTGQLSGCPSTTCIP
jgi:hypothetical protein